MTIQKSFLLLNYCCLVRSELIRLRIEQTIFRYRVDNAHHFTTEFHYACSREHEHITFITQTLSTFRGVGAGSEMGGSYLLWSPCCSSFLWCVMMCVCVLFVFILCLVCPMLPMALECPLLVASSVFTIVAPFPLFRFSYIACLSCFPVHFESPPPLFR